MKSIRRLVSCSVGAAAVIFHISAGSVSAEPASDCSCTTALVSNAAAKGHLIDVTGDVFVSGPHGYAQAKSGQSLALNSNIIVGPKATAHLRYGQCKVTAPADSTASISAKDQSVCVNVTKTFEGTVEQSAGFAGLDTAALTPFFVGVGSLGFGFVGLVVAVTDGNKASD